MQRFLSKLAMWQKFALIGMLAVVMVGIPAAMVVNTNLQAVAQARANAEGIPPAGTVLKLLQLTQQMRGLSVGYLVGNEAMGATRQQKQPEMEQALAQAADLISSRFAGSSLVTDMDALGRDWQPLVTSVGNRTISQADSFAAHTRLVSVELALLSKIASVSGLTLNPEPGSNHVSRAVLKYLPTLSENLGQARAFGGAILTRGAATPQERLQITMLKGMAEENLRNVEAEFRMAFANDDGMRERIETSLAVASAAVHDGLRLMTAEILEADSLDYSSTEYFARMTKAIDTQFDVIYVAFKALDDRLDARVDAGRHELWVTTAAIAVLGFLATALVVLVTRTVVRSMQQAVRVAQTVASGDLTSNIDTTATDETGQLLQALKHMNANLAGIVGDVRHGTHAIASASRQIAAGNQDLSVRTEEQASALEQTAASMEEMASTVAQNADNARQAGQLAESAAQAAVQGNAVVERMVHSMATIKASSGKIGDIVAIIDGIAFQTNILALNAAVEAARAGEQGRGFAVVAGEVRTLAQRSASAAREIKDLITGAVGEVALGSELAGDAGKSMESIVDSVRKVADIMGEITAASQEQTTGIEQISRAVSQMDEVTQQNAALVEQAAAAAHSLEEQASHLVGAVQAFRTESAGLPNTTRPAIAMS